MKANPSVEDYVAGFKKCHDRIASRMKLLHAHVQSPQFTATMTQLAKKVGYANFNAVNLQYGTLARYVSEAMGLYSNSLEDPSYGWIHNLVTFEGEPGEHWKLTLRPNVLAAYFKLYPPTAK